MNNSIQANQTPSSYTSLIALQLTSEDSSSILLLSPYKHTLEPIEKYHTDMDPSSYDSFTSVDKMRTSNITIDEIISGFYTKLSEHQEDLGAEFKGVYFKNAWDLYDN